MTTRTTHTYAFLEVKPATFEEIAAKLRSAGYDHAFDADAQHGELIDLHGLALVVDPEHRERHLAHVPFRALCELEEKGQKTMSEWPRELRVREFPTVGGFPT